MIRLFTSTTSFQQTVTTLSLHSHISTSTTTSLQHLKSLLPPKIIIFYYFILSSTRNKIHWLTNTAIILPIQVQYNSTPFTSHISTNPLKYTTLLHYSHITNTHKKTSRMPSSSTPKCTFPQRLLFLFSQSNLIPYSPGSKRCSFHLLVALCSEIQQSCAR